MPAPEATAPDKLGTARCPILVDNRRDPGQAEEPRLVAGARALTDADMAPDAFWSHRGALCTFELMLSQPGLRIPALERLAANLRGADTARPELAPEAPGLLAASLGLSRIYPDDPAQLEAGMALHDAFHRWCRDAPDDTRAWPSNRTGGAA